MQNVRYGLIALCMLLGSVTSAPAEVSIGIGIGLPNVSIGINLPLFPELVRVPGYPVYYAPRLEANYFFYDGMYWVYQDDNWYASSWYNGPWWLVEPDVVPVFILRVPVRYYRQPPVYFRGWRSNAPPRWGEHWGRDWEQHRRGWDRWKRGSAPAPAPLPVYQRQYTGDRYPRAVEQQQSLRRENYRYQPRNTVVRQHFQQGGPKAAPPAQRGRQEGPPSRTPRQQEMQRPAPPQQGIPAGPRSQPQYRGGENVPRAVPVQPPPQQRAPAVEDHRQRPGAVQREMQAPRPEGQPQRSNERRESQEPGRGRGQGEQRDEGRGRER